MPDQPHDQPPEELTALEPNRAYVFHDGGTSDPKTRELHGRIAIWHSTLMQCTEWLHSSIRAFGWGAAEGAKAYLGDPEYVEWRKTQSDYEPGEPFSYAAWRAYRLQHVENFPGDASEGFGVAAGLSQAAVVSFMTIFHNGKADPGNVAGNKSAAVRALRESWFETAFPNLDERTEFRALVERLKSVRDPLFAHAEGEAYDVRHGDNVSSHRLPTNAVSQEDVRRLYSYALRLLDSVASLRALC